MDRKGWRLGVLAATSIVVVVYIALQIFLFQQSEYYIPIGVLILFMFSGIVIKLMFHGRPAEIYTMLDARLRWMSVALIMAGFVAIRLLAWVTALSVSLPTVLFGILAAICETWGVNAGVQTAFEVMSGSNWIGVVAGAGVAVGLHWQVYAQTGMVLVFVGLAFVVLNILYKLSGDRLEIPMITHILHNVGDVLLALLLGVI